MKKIFRFFAAFAALTMAFSCVEEANPEVGTENGGTSYDGPMITLTFGLDELETKTAWDGEKHTWSDGDQIKIIWMDDEGQVGDVTAKVTEGCVSAEVGIADHYYAVYPETTAYVLETPEDATEPQFSVTIPKYQDGSFAQANIMAAKTSASETVLAFKNLTHILKFNLSEGCEYNFFRFYSNSSGDGIRPGASPSLVTFGEDVTVGVPVTNGMQSGYVIAKGLSGVGPHYIGVRAGTDYEGGFGFLASKENSEGTLKSGTISTATLNTVRGGISNLGTLDSYLFDDFYITKTGEGSGKSWSDPAGIDMLKNLLQLKKQDGTAYGGGNNTTKYYRFNDVTIHIAAGEYALASDNTAYSTGDLTKANITVVGGYPASPSEDSVPEVGTDGSQTVFTVDGTGGTSSRIMVIGKQTGNLTFKNISFKKAGATAAGALLRVNSKAAGTLTYDNCYFSAQGGNGTNYGFIRIEAETANSSDLNVNFNSCSFVGNDAIEGASMKSGVFYIACKCKVNFDECTFKNNKADQVADIKTASGAQVFINRTLFQGGYAAVNSSNWYGSSITTTSADTLCINNCIFDSYTNVGEGTSSSRNLPVIFSQGHHYLINTSVYGSSSQNVRVTLSNEKCTNFNNVIVNTKSEGFSIVQSNSKGISSNYNLLTGLSTGGGNYTEYQDFDTGITAEDIRFVWSVNNFTWELLNGKSLKANMTKAALMTKTESNYPAFDKWLKTVETDPYGIDYNGNKRNAEKLNPGAWDPGL